MFFRMRVKMTNLEVMVSVDGISGLSLLVWILRAGTGFKINIKILKKYSKQVFFVI